MVEVVIGVGKSVGSGGAGNRELDRGIVADSLRFLESSEKTSYTIAHSRSMSAMSF